MHKQHRGVFVWLLRDYHSSGIYVSSFYLLVAYLVDFSIFRFVATYFPYVILVLFQNETSLRCRVLFFKIVVDYGASVFRDEYYHVSLILDIIQLFLGLAS